MRTDDPPVEGAVGRLKWGMSGMREPKRRGTIVLIGGAEEKGPSADVLGRFVEALDGRKLVVMTCATEDPEGAWERYRNTFQELGVQEIAHVDVRDRVMALDDKTSAPLDGAGGVFFTGGDQLRITSHLGATPAFRRIKTIVDEGGIVAGTSVGA